MSRASLIVSLAVRVAWSTDRSQRWRQVTLVLAALMSVTAMALGAGIVSASQQAAQRILDRTPAVDFASPDAPLHAVVRGGFLDVRQFPVLWLDPRAGDAPVPPGLSRLPDPGTYVVSPALAEAGVADALGWRTSAAGSGVRGTIGDDGLASPSEWYAYARPADGRSLGAGGALAPVAGFGVADATSPQLSVETDPIMPSPLAALFGSLWLLTIPALVALVPAASAGSDVRARRARVLFLLGSRPVDLMALGALETSALVAPAALVAALTCAAAAPHVGHVPVAGIDLRAGDLSIPAGQSAAIALAAVVVAGAVGALRLRPGDPSVRGRSVRRVRWFSAVPLWLAVSGIVAARLFTRPTSVLILLATLVVTTLALPLALPWLVRRAAVPLARLRGVGPWLAGRRLAADARGLARPAATLALLVFVLGAGSGVYLQMTAADAPESSGVYEVGWREPRPGDVASLRDALPGVAVGYRTSSGTAVFDSCEDLARGLADEGCGEPDALVRRARIALGAPVEVAHVVEEVSPDVVAGGAVVLARTGAVSLDEVEAAASHLPAADVAPRGEVAMAAPYIARWCAAALVAAAALLSAGAALAFGNRVLAVSGEDAVLLALGAEPRTVRSVQRWSVAWPMAVAVPAAGAAAVLFTWAASAADLAATATTVILLECAIVVGFAAVLLAALAAVQRRRARR
ncbi:hypothetical protein [Cellulomonas gilvus]|uniref:Permease n=1 Tax=Cellulomonas gilvus (strain ATCC 13127 / NRRL B-14078) TaxID=593907 RepID=F8A5U9_CELGA|nr:hypothetical protein [Cellulomonas gilvus]AEI13389.1 protein of unknown function DUF214 [Cellulomonas gilvus ATCC 13127]